MIEVKFIKPTQLGISKRKSFVDKFVPALKLSVNRVYYQR